MYIKLKPLAKDRLAFFIYYSGIAKFLRFLGRKSTKILLYHSVSDFENNFIRGTNVWISAKRFEKHLKFLIKNYKIISLNQFVHFLEQNKILYNSAIITFDDGFADNYSFVYPLLKKYKIPATIFLTTDCIGNEKPLWIQEITYIINNVSCDKVVHLLNIISSKLNIKPLNLSKPSGINNRDKIESYLTYSIGKKAREEIISKLYKKLNIQREKILAKNKIYLNWQQIKLMRANNINFGNHGVSHTAFSAMSKEEQKEEIVKSKKIIQTEIGNDFIPFSYPYGQKNDFNSVTKNLIKRHGHSCILTAISSLNYKNTSPYELGRIVIDNIPVYQLAFHLEKGTLKHLLKIEKT